MDLSAENIELLLEDKLDAVSSGIISKFYNDTLHEYHNQDEIEGVLSRMLNKVVDIVVQFALSRTRGKQLDSLRQRSEDMFEKIRPELHNNSGYRMVFYIGYEKACSDITTLLELDDMSNIDQEQAKEALSYTHTAALIDTLERRYQLSNKELAEELGISPSALSNTLKRLDPYGLFVTRRVGVKTLYSISSKGRAVCQSMRESEIGNIQPTTPPSIIDEMPSGIVKALIAVEEGSSTVEEAVSQIMPAVSRVSSKSRSFEVGFKRVARKLSKGSQGNVQLYTICYGKPPTKLRKESEAGGWLQVRVTSSDIQKGDYECLEMKREWYCPEVEQIDPNSGREQYMGRNIRILMTDDERIIKRVASEA